MSAVGLGETEARTVLEPFPELALAAVNAPASCTVSGPAAVLARLRQILDSRSVEHRTLRTSHAFHSSMMEPILEPFLRELARIELRAPRLPYLSNLTGTWIGPDEATDPAYWTEHLRRPVRFDDGVEALLAEPDLLLLEVGPGSALSAAVRQRPQKATEPRSRAGSRDQGCGHAGGAGGRGSSRDRAGRGGRASGSEAPRSAGPASMPGSAGGACRCPPTLSSADPTGRELGPRHSTKAQPPTPDGHSPPRPPQRRRPSSRRRSGRH